MKNTDWKCKACGMIHPRRFVQCSCGARSDACIQYTAGCLIIDDDDEEEWPYYQSWEGKATVKGNYLEF